MSRSPYRSALREEQAAQTRRRIQEAARRLFGEVGFTATTIGTVAAAAGVSPATVYATFESKAGLVAALLEDVEEQAGMGARSPEMLGEPDARHGVALFVAGNRAVFASGQDVLRAAYEARSLPEVAALIRAGDANRRRGTDALVARWHRQGALRPGLDAVEASQTLWLLAGAEVYLLSVDTLGWSPEEYESWLTGLLQRELLRT